MAVPTTANEAFSIDDLTAKRSWRSVKSAFFTFLMGAAFVIVMIPLALIIFQVVSKGVGIISANFLTDDIQISARRKGGGMGPAIAGTLLITAAATVMAVPLGILGAVYLNEYSANGRFGRVVRFMATVMTGVPSVVMGLFVFVVYTLHFGLDAFGGALALAALMLPIVIRSTEEMLKLVPNNLREASAALGTRKSRTILTVVLPAALPGVVSGCLLAVARAAGETAPVLFVVGAAGARSTNWDLFNGLNTTLSAQIFNNATSPFNPAQDRAWGAALTLLALAFLITLVARLVTARFALKR
jgi:phosphate transport system permease protein